MSETEERDGHAGRVTSVFFSYSRADQDKALPIIRAIEQAGFSVWWDGVLKGGVKYVETTGEALESARAVVVLWSRDSIKSHWVLDEAMNGRERSCLVPITLDGSQPPLGFKQFQVIDLSKWRGAASAPEMTNLINTISDLHEADFVPMPVSQSPQSHGLSRRHLMLGAGGIATLGAVGAAMLLWPDGDRLSSNGIAVLPFQNDSGDPDQDYLSAGISTELRNTLARNPGLKVVARSTSEAIEAQKLEARRAARELGVSFIVEGSVRASNELVRVSSFLIDGATGKVRWSDTYQQSLDQLLDIQLDLTAAISSELSLAVSSALGHTNIGAASNPAAFDSYLRGWTIYRASSDTETDLLALARFDNAIRLDPNFAAAHAARSATLTVLGNFSDDPVQAKSYKDQALQAAQKAVELGPDLDEAHSALALSLFDSQLKIREARGPYERSIELGRGSAVTQARYAEYAALTGQAQAARSAIDFALELDPLNSNLHRSSGLIHYVAGEYEKAISAHQQAVRLEQNLSDSHAWMGLSLLQLDRDQTAIDTCLKEPSSLLRLPCLAIGYDRLDRRAEAETAMAQLVAEYGQAGRYQQAQVLAQWGDLDAAMAALRDARAAMDAGLTYLFTDPLLLPLHQRQDFQSLQSELGFT